jgi:hypothetical protein
MNRKLLGSWARALAITGAVAAGSHQATAQTGYDDLAPSVQIICPANPSALVASSIPADLQLRFTGVDPDAPDGRPSRYRVLVKPALDPTGTPLSTRTAFLSYVDWLLAWDDAQWTDWIPWPAPGSFVEYDLTGLMLNQYYAVALQVMDRDGAVSLGRVYQRDVGHFRVVSSFVPALALSELYLGTSTASETSRDIAGGQQLNFWWTADAGAYCGSIVSLRHGWDVIDVNDPADPGWAVPAGLAPQNFRAAERSFSQGLHTLQVRAEDDKGGVRFARWILRVIPFVDRQFQLPLLVIDQTYDRNSMAWPDQAGAPRNEQAYRNAYWHFLAEGAGGVADLNWNRDWMDHSATVTYENLVGYKAVLCYAVAGANQAMFNQFRPVGDTDSFVWLTPYQQQGGNFMLVGGPSMGSFLQLRSDYMTPIIFDTNETTYQLFGDTYIIGFGMRTMPDGAEVLRGPLLYPYATAGISALDWTSPVSKHVYGRAAFISTDRNRLCAGLKGLVLSPEFKATHLIGPGVVPDTMYTNPEIDWRDPVAAVVDELSLFDQQAFPFDNDEFVDANITSRATPITPQECSGEAYAEANVPNGMCVEPMFTGIARMDWMREAQWARGDTGWPQNRYDAETLDSGCGPMALTEYAGRPQSSARTNGKVFGYLSYKMVPSKQYRVADVYWGFDPYRFDGAGTRKAIRWVLQYFGLQINQ